MSFKGQVIVGYRYIKGMLCSADTDGDGVDDAFATEPTDEIGYFTIQGLQTRKNITITCNLGHYDVEEMNKPDTPFHGTLKAPAGYEKVTPISTLIFSLMYNGKTLNEAEDITRSFLGLNADHELNADYIVNADRAASTAAQVVNEFFIKVESSATFSELMDALAKLVIEKTDSGHDPKISDDGMLEAVAQKADGTANPSDTTAPVITLNGVSVVEVYQGDSYIDMGATASDNIDGDLSDNIVVWSDLDTEKVGSYSIIFNVRDTARNSAEQVIRTVHVIESAIKSALDSSLLPPQVPSLQD